MAEQYFVQVAGHEKPRPECRLSLVWPLPRLGWDVELEVLAPFVRVRKCARSIPASALDLRHVRVCAWN